MALYFYSGTPGSGKSLHVAMEIEKKLRSGGNVIANFEFDADSVKPKFRREKGDFIYVDNADLQKPIVNDKGIFSPVDRFYRFAKKYHEIKLNGKVKEHQTLVVFDEAQMLFNSRAWQDKYRQDWVKFFTLHRHYGYDIILVSQFDRLLDRQVRGVFEEEVNHKKLLNYNTLGAILSMPFRGNLFVAVTHWHGATGKADVSHRKFFFGRKKYYDYYNSYKMFD